MLIFRFADFLLDKLRRLPHSSQGEAYLFSKSDTLSTKEIHVEDSPPDASTLENIHRPEGVSHHGYGELKSTGPSVFYDSGFHIGKAELEKQTWHFPSPVCGTNILMMFRRFRREKFALFLLSKEKLIADPCSRHHRSRTLWVISLL